MRALVILVVSGVLAALGYVTLKDSNHATWIGTCIAYPGFITAFMLGGGIHGQTWQHLARAATIVNFIFYVVLMGLVFVFWDKYRMWSLRS